MRSGKLIAFGIILLAAGESSFAQEATMEEIVVEAPFDVRLEKSRQSDVQIMIERLTLRAETKREAELEVANRTPLNTLLDLTKYSPIPLGGSDPRIDPFTLQSYMRPELNPRDEKSIFSAK